ncbi:MAG: peroxiredoxin [Gemmataceae bacterium]|nr:peroxiredoxin [Gemmataceae bacterium]
MRWLSLAVALVGVGVLGRAAMFGQEKTTGKALKVGDKAPVFESIDDTGKPWKSTDYVGKKIVVLYFYPADFTGGCTAQACGYRDEIEKSASKDVEIVGISGDSVSTHKLFKSYHKLNFTLLADEKGQIAKLFGVPVNKGGESPIIDADGKKGKAPRGVTIARWTVVIDKAGTIAAIDSVGKAGEDPKRVAAIIKKLETK